MKILKSILFGTLIGFCATMLHNLYSPYGFIASLILTFLGIRVIGQTLFKVSYQLIAALAWLVVVLKAGTPGTGDELLIYGNTYGNLFLIGGLFALLLGLVVKKSNFR
jgi:uncharacterized membrane protein YeaQ/YmgE (transglycosylase-associated protein family)